VQASEDKAREIMALVDEFPSEPLSFERRGIIEKLTAILAQFADDVESEQQSSFDVGYDCGYNDGCSEKEEDLNEEILNLEDKISELEEEVSASYDEGFAAGLAAASENTQ
jgi:flagellar biosynthesis/type III secretory pathway protein FliH